MKKFVIFLLTAISVESSFACLNEYYTTADGQSSDAISGIGTLYRSFDTAFSQKYVDYYNLDKKEDYYFEELSDVSVHLARLGRYKESLNLLLWLFERHPEEYSINANLGTLYELNGNVDSAYYFIERSMQLNEDAHEGTEWVHLSILRAKQQIAKDPNWLLTHRVFDLKLNTPTDVDSEENFRIIDTIDAIIYQMHERVPFTPLPDPILADIFDELGDLMAMHYSIEQAYIAYSISLRYGSQDRYNTQTELDQVLVLLKEKNLEIPDINEHFPALSEHYNEDESRLPGNRQKKNIEPEKNIDESSFTWVWFVSVAGVIGIVLLVFFRKKSVK